MPPRHYWDMPIWLRLASGQLDPKSTVGGLWQMAQNGSVEVIYSAITVAELLVKPAANTPRPWPDPHEFDQIFDSPHLLLVQVDRVIGERARSLRRRHNLKTPDAIHLACALQHNAELFVTEDSDFANLGPLTCSNSQVLEIVNASVALHGPMMGDPSERLPQLNAQTPPDRYPGAF